MVGFGLNARAGELADRMRQDAAALRIGVSAGPLGETLIDCGTRRAGGIEAGLRLAAICMGGLGTVALAPSESSPRWPWHLVVRSSQPVAACLGSQYAGWALKHKDESTNFFALGSGPARALARREPLFEELSIDESSDRAVLVLDRKSVV
jgi:methenyltetrahydromethanopterin cyclohydrolase